MNKEKQLISQRMREISPEMDPLRLGTGWSVEDLSKPQIFIESTFGDSHPGSGHLDKLVAAAREGVSEEGGHGARYFTTDMCDGESQGTDGINYSLASREMIANMIEIQANATPFDAGVFIASCDKGMPGNLMGLARVNIPSVVVTGGTMAAGPEMLTLEQLGMYSAKYERGEIDKSRLDWAKQNACPSCGACSFIGTASTMQIMAEALGLTLPGSALLPATSPDLVEYAREAGRQAVIVTLESFENAILVHAAISGSTNALLHIPAIAHEFGITITGDTFDRLHRGAHYLLNVRPAGEYPAEFFYYAGGVPAIMEEIKSVLHLDVMTITGKTLGENLEELKKNGFYDRCQEWLDKASSSIPPARRKCSKQRCMQDRLIPKRNASTRYCTTRYSPVTPYLSATKVPRAPACPKCSIRRKPFPRIRNLASRLPLLQTVVFPVLPPALSSVTAHRKRRQAVRSLSLKRVI